MQSLRLVFLAGLIVSGCGDDGSPPIDAAPLSIDAPALCATPNACPCFSNDDCPGGTRCHAEDPDHVYCMAGPRGTAAAGATCAGENDCASALCVEGTDTMRCSKVCMTNTECPAELPRCLGGIGICARS